VTSTVASFDRIVATTDGIGTFEHADHAVPRREHGYCTDDMARVLVLIAREPHPSPAVRGLARTAFRFLVDAQGVTGDVRNRCTIAGRWIDRRGVEDCWGRSLWAFGAAARSAPEAWMRQSALARFERGIERRSPWPRAMTFAALGAAEVLAVEPRHLAAKALLRDAVTAIGPIATDAAWPWPEARLTYANAAIPEVLLAAGALLSRPELVDDGLTLLRWLLARETLDGHLSPTPVGGSGPGDDIPGFDQQAIEVAATADACARAATVTGDGAWHREVERAWGWFGGANDAGATMWDPVTNGGYDGLQRSGPNLNQGAESTLALISTAQRVAALAPSAP
jgi:hypothetical protein